MIEQAINPALRYDSEGSIPTVETVQTHTQELADTIDFLENRPDSDSESANYQRIFELKQQIKDELGLLDSIELPKLASKTSVYNESPTLTELILDVACAKVEAMEVSEAMRDFVRRGFDEKAGVFYEKLEKNLQRQSLVRGDLEVLKPWHDKPQIRNRRSSADSATNLNSDDTDVSIANEIPRLILTGRKEPVYDGSIRSRIQGSKTLEYLTRTNRLTKRVFRFMGAAALAGSAGLALGIEVGIRL